MLHGADVNQKRNSPDLTQQIRQLGAFGNLEFATNS